MGLQTTKRAPAAVVLVLVAGAAVAHATPAPANHRVSETMSTRLLSSDKKSATYSGTIQDKRYGAGGVLVRATPTGEPSKAHIVATGYFASGTVTVKGDVVTTVRHDASGFDYSSSAKVVDGTRRFKGATGRLKLVGSSTHTDASYQTWKVTGTLTY